MSGGARLVSSRCLRLHLNQVLVASSERERPWCLSIMRVMGAQTDDSSISLWHQGQSALWEGERKTEATLTDTRAAVSSMIHPPAFPRDCND